MEADALDRIINAAGNAPTELDKRQLLNDLEGAASLLRTGTELRHKPAKRQQLAAKIDKAARRLQVLISEYGVLRHHLGPLDRLIADVANNSRIESTSKLAHVLGLNKASAFEQLVGLYLKNIFEDHFGVKASYTKRTDTENVEHPFISFVDAALKELGITNSGMPYSRQSMGDALTKVDPKRGRKRQIDA